LLNTDPDTEELCLTYIKRPSNNPHDKHGGQISFPGGQREPHDKDLKETAIRETEEELGLSREHFEVLGPISKVYVFVSDFNVQPYVGYAKEPLVFAPQKSEVDYVINYPLKKLVTNPILSKDHTIRGFTLKDIPYYNLQGETLWGATGMMTAEFLKIINDYNLHRLL